jgi:hypothetical protein
MLAADGFPHPSLKYELSIKASDLYAGSAMLHFGGLVLIFRLFLGGL